MFKKNDPLVDSVKAVMKVNDSERLAEAAVNQEFGVTSKNALPHELRAKYNERLAEAKKCMYEGKPIHPNQKVIAKQDGDETDITDKDLKILRAKKKAGVEISEKWKKELEEDKDYKMVNPGLEKKAKEKEEKKEKKLEEKLTKSMSTGDVISDFVHSDNPKFKGKSKKKRIDMALGAYYSKHPEKSKKKKMEESVDSITEEIRNNLQEKLVAVHESGDQAAFEAFVTSLTEEQLAILGLNEETPSVTAAKPLPTTSAPAPAEKPVGQNPTPSIMQRVAGVSADIKGTGADPYAYNKSSIPTGGTEKGDFNKPSHLAGGGPTQVASSSTSGTTPTGGGISGDTGRTSVNKGQTNQAGAIYGNTSSGKLALQNKPIATKNPTAGSGSVSPTNVATKASAPIKTSSVNRTPIRPTMNRPNAARTNTPVRTTAAQDFMSNFMREDTETKPQIKESFEKFLRNTFLKG